MTNHNFFKDIFIYNHDINQKWLKHLSDLNIPLSETMMKLFSHIINAHHIWNCRILQKPSNINVWQIHTLQELIKMDKQNFYQSLEIIENDTLDRVVLYTNTENRSFQNCILEILFHIVNHSTHHRAQIAKEIRASGYSIPEKTDYIIYKREN